MASSLINVSAGKGQERGLFYLPLLAPPLIMIVLGEEVTKIGSGYNMNHMNNII